MRPERRKAFDQMVEDSLNMLSPDERQTLEEGMNEIAKALSWFFEGRKPHPDTLVKISKLIERRENNIFFRGKVTISKTAACKNIIAPNTAKEYAPELWNNWYDTDYRPAISSKSSK